MLSYKTRYIIFSLFVAVSLIFSGCGSTNSDKEQIEEFDSGRISPGGTFSYTFDSEGTIEYYCSIHKPDMQGEITVSSSAQAVQSDTVKMEGDQFHPSSLTVAPNTKVVWVNNDSHDHRVMSGNPSSDGGGYGY